MQYSKSETDRILKIYNSILSDISKRVEEFEDIIRNGSDGDIITELVFCIFTPQSKARNCWNAVCDLKEKDILFRGKAHDILPCINNVRFKNRKSEFACNARNMFYRDGSFFIKEFISSWKDISELRDWLVKNIKGYGYKEASHFLRNIGLGKELAILDRHILKNIVKLNIIPEIPKNLNRKNYIAIEDRMREFCDYYGIRMDYLDLVLWYSEAGEIFK